DRKEKEVSRPTEARHRFKVKSSPLKLRLVVRNVDGKPLPNVECDLMVEGEKVHLTTNSSGQIEQDIPRTAKSGFVVFKEGATPFCEPISLKIGHLDPVETRSGQIGRLNNLG